MHAQGLRPICSVQGGNRREYAEISTRANAAMGKTDQIRKTSKWLCSRSEMPLPAELLHGRGHFPPICSASLAYGSLI
jgi:hypothetical protein